MSGYGYAAATSEFLTNSYGYLLVELSFFPDFLFPEGPCSCG